MSKFRRMAKVIGKSLDALAPSDTQPNRKKRALRAITRKRAEDYLTRRPRGQARSEAGGGRS